MEEEVDVETAVDEDVEAEDGLRRDMVRIESVNRWNS
jgi:hypothetical protein